MAGKKSEERFESVEKEIKEVRAIMEKGIGEVRVELIQNLTETRRLMEKRMKLFSKPASTLEKTRALTMVVDKDREAVPTGVVEPYLAEVLGLRKRNEDRVTDPRVLRNMSRTWGRWARRRWGTSDEYPRG